MMLGWLGVRIFIPFLPVAIDFLLRRLMLSEHLMWWQMVDLKTFSISGAFFCLLIAIESKNDGRLPSDENYELSLKTFKTHMTVAGVLLAVFFGITTVAEYQDIRNPQSGLDDILLPPSLIIMFSVTIFAVATAFFANLKFRFQF